MNKKREIPLPPHKYQPPCVKMTQKIERITPGKIPKYYNAFPRDCKFAYMTPEYYATGFRILDVYKSEIDFSEIRRLFFLEDPNLVEKWGDLRARIPYAESRVIGLSGISALKYNNYCLRNLTPRSAASWRNSINKNASD